jgi:transposase
MKAYSPDLRQEVLAAALRGDRTAAQVAASFGVGTTFVDKALVLRRAGAGLTPRPHGGGYPARLPPRHEELLRAAVRRQKGAALAGLRDHLEGQDALEVSISTVSRALIRPGLGRKKKSDGE